MNRAFEHQRRVTANSSIELPPSSTTLVFFLLIPHGLSLHLDCHDLGFVMGYLSLRTAPLDA